MKTLSLIIYFLLLAAINLSAQSKISTNNEEIQVKIYQAQQQLDKLSPAFFTGWTKKYHITKPGF